MSSVKVLRIESSISPPLLPSNLPLFPINSSRRHSATPKSSNNVENALLFEVKTSSFNRNIEIKTKQQDEIYRINKSLPTITCSTLSSTPNKIQIHPTSSSNSSIQRVRVSVSSSSSPYQNESIKSNSVDQKKEETFNRRPLFEILNNPLINIPNLDNPTKTLPSSRILPPKQLTPFKPIILHKKSQESIDHFDIIGDQSKDSPSSTRRNGVIRSHTFATPDDINSNSNNSPIICQSTPELTRSNKSINSSLSTSGISLTNATPTSNTNIDDKNEARRKAIAMQMYDTEKSYVEALKNLVTKYYLPMKDKDIVSNELINDIFYKIPEIHIHHTAFLISLSQKLSQWDNKQTVGDLLLQMFTRTSVIETYTSFVNNYKTAQIAIRLCRDYSSFNKFVEQQARDHRGRLTLSDLIIQPVQRIPRYELFIKDFLKCTNLNHPDYQLLLKAQSEIHSLAEQIDQVQKEVGSDDFNIQNNSLEVVQDMIENLTDLVNDDRYYIRHDVVTLQSSSGLKKDRCIFLFNDLIIITSCKRRTGNLNKKNTNSIIVNSPSGKQYIDNAKHKLIMKIPLESVDLAADYLKKRRSSISTPPSLIKSHSIASSNSDKHRHLEEDALILSQMTDLAKTMTIPHQHLDDSIKETLDIVTKHLHDETNIRRMSPDPHILSDNIQLKSNYIHLILNTTEHTETIDVLFSSSQQKISWERNFLEAKKILLEISAGRRNISFQQVLILPHSRAGSQFTCGTVRHSSDDLCLCNSEGQICLMNIESDVALKSCSAITSSRINCIGYIPSNKVRKSGNTIKIRHDEQKINNKQELNNYQRIEGIDSLLDIDSSDDDGENLSLNNSSINSFENEEQDTREATIWIGTQNGGLYIYGCSQTMKIVGRKNRIVKQLNCSIHSILYTDNKVFLALNHGQLCVFKRDFSGHWDLDSPIIRSIEEKSQKSDNKNGELDNGETNNPISVIASVAGKLWCGIKDKIFVVCPNSLDVQHSFIVDDCQRHISSIATGGSSMHHVWIATQDSHDIRLYHATHFVCLFETSIRTAVTQKLQVCDDVIRSHKLGCLHVSALHVCKEALWIGTSAGVIINLSISQLIDPLSTNGINKLTANSIQLKGLAFGHAGPVRFIMSTDKNIISKTDENNFIKTFVITIGDGFEDFNQNDENLGKDDAISHLILWKL